MRGECFCTVGFFFFFGLDLYTVNAVRGLSLNHHATPETPRKKRRRQRTRPRGRGGARPTLVAIGTSLCNSITQKKAKGPERTSPRLFRLLPGTGGVSRDLSAFDTGVISGAILFIKGAFGVTPFAEEVLVGSALIGRGLRSNSGVDALPMWLSGAKRGGFLSPRRSVRWGGGGSMLCAVAGNYTR